MDLPLPANAPKTTGEAFAFIQEMRKGCTVDDLAILALGEGMGQALYDDLADRAGNPEVARLLRENGVEELRHAHRVSKVIELLTGRPFPIPPIEQNPIYTGLPPMPVTKENLLKLAEGEFAGEDLYDDIAANFDNAEAIALFKLNGKEELEHGARLAKAAALLPG